MSNNLETIEWIPVEKEPPKFPCIACDNLGNYPFIPLEIVTINNKYYDAKGFDFNKEKFLKGEEVVIDGEKAHILPREIIAWFPLPDPYIKKS